MVLGSETRPLVGAFSTPQSTAVYRMWGEYTQCESKSHKMYFFAVTESYPCSFRDVCSK